MNTKPRPFCALPLERTWLETETTIAFLDGFPVTVGHTLVMPKQHLLFPH